MRKAPLLVSTVLLLLGDEHVHPFAAIWSIGSAVDPVETRLVPQRCLRRNGAGSLAARIANTASSTGNDPWVRDAEARVLPPADLSAYGKARSF